MADAELWSRIRADYLTTGLSYSKLAERYGVSLPMVKKVARKEHWTADKAKVDAVTNQVSDSIQQGKGTEAEIVTIADIRRDRYERFMEASDAMMDRIVEALTSPEVISPYSLKLLASALRDLREMQGLNKSALDIEEQQARIAKLRSETRTTETEEGGGVIFMPVMEPRPEPPEALSNE